MSIILAFSGGLDTSFCVPYLRETYGTPVHTVTVDTGGLRPGDAEAIAERAADLGAASHTLINGKKALYDDHLSYLIRGNIRRGGVYPLCVGPERVVQARAMVQAAADHGSTAIAHGSTGAGNDQVRFDVAIQVLSRSMLGREIDVVAPIRSLGLTRAASTDYLLERGFDVPSETTAYSINRGLWGTTIGGEETLTTQRPLPEDAYPDTVPPKEAPDEAVELEITFEQGLPVAVDGQGMDGVALVEHLNDVGGAHGVGRDIHVGDTILGIKGRVGFEAPAAEVLLTAHRELEKLVLSKWQQVKKDEMARFYGMLLHEGQYFDPVMRDIEAHLLSSQAAVSGTVNLELYKGGVSVLGADSPNSLFNADLATYGEENALWNGRDAEGFTRLAGISSLLAAASGAGASPASPPLASITGPSVTPISG